MPDKNIIQRAIEIAREGQGQRIDDIERTLAREGYMDVSSHLAGPSIRATLRAQTPRTSSKGR